MVKKRTEVQGALLRHALVVVFTVLEELVAVLFCPRLRILLRALLVNLCLLHNEWGSVGCGDVPSYVPQRDALACVVRADERKDPAARN